MLRKKIPRQIKINKCHQNQKQFLFFHNTTSTCHYINQNKLIFPSAVQTLPYPNLFLASFNALILILVTLSVIEMFFPFILFLLVNTRLLSIYLTNLTQILPLLGTPILFVQSIFNLFTTTSSVSLF